MPNVQLVTQQINYLFQHQQVGNAISVVSLDECDRHALSESAAEQRPQLPTLEPFLHSPHYTPPITVLRKL